MAVAASATAHLALPVSGTCVRTAPSRVAYGAVCLWILVAPFEGSGHSIIDGKRFDWKEYDNLAVPGGSWFEHVNGNHKGAAILFIASDEPALKCFSLFKKWGRDSAGDIVKLA